jgi:hypothetical protein
METDLQSLFGLHVHSLIHWLSPRNPHPPPRINTRALLVCQNRQHLFVTPCWLRMPPDRPTEGGHPTNILRHCDPVYTGRKNIIRL